MAHIFLSYASEDRDRAREVAVDLEALGWDVWWDRRLQAGKTFAGVIESEIAKAGCVLVLWSKASIGSRWVRDEANEGLERNILVPALIEQVEPPMGFRSIHAANLIDYGGDQNAPGFRQLVADLSALMGPPPSAPARLLASPEPRPLPDRWKLLRGHWPLVAAAVVVALGAWGMIRYIGDYERRTAELEARQKAFEEQRRRADEDAARRQAELEARDRAAAEKARVAEADAARRAEAERARIAAAAEAARRAEAERESVAAEAARRKADEERKRQQVTRVPPKPVEPAAPPPPQATPAAPAAEAASKLAAVEPPKPAVAEPPKPAAPETPAPEPPRVAARSPLLPSPGDTWSYRYVDGFRRGEVARLTYRVEAVSEAGVGESLSVSNRPDYASRATIAREPRFGGHAGLDYAPPDFAPYLQAFYKLEEGVSLPAVKRVFTSDATIPMQMRVAGREQVTVPAGTFDTIKVVAEGRGETFINRIPMHSIITIWYAPAAKRFVKFDARTYERTFPQELATFELVDYKVVR
jgi:hypothetical protein